MKLLWLCNMMPAKVKAAIGGAEKAGGLWVDRVLEGLRRQETLTIRVICPGDGAEGILDEKCSYRTFRQGLPYDYSPQLEAAFQEELKTFAPDVVHIWGTEYAHTLAMVNACEEENLLEHTVISIQGLCSVYAGHYEEGLPSRLCRESSLRDILRRDNIRQQRKKFLLRGQLEIKALEKARHVMGRTDWDRFCVARINPQAQYHFCNETLRADFYDGRWAFGNCQKYRIFASSCAYPVKGFHYLLEAMAQLRKVYPDTTLAVPGKDPRTIPWYRRSSYHNHLIRQMKRLNLGDNVEFLGSLSAAEMKEAYLAANVFALPSTIENSPNSLGEAMLLGVPCVAADVGGVSDLMVHRQEGFVYQSTAPYMLSGYIQKMFALEEKAEGMTVAARMHAGKTHDPEKNLKTLLTIYQDLAEQP